MDRLDDTMLLGLLKAGMAQSHGGQSTADTALVPPATAPIRHLTENDLARRWRMSVRTLQAWRWRKVGPPYLKAMGRVLYRLSDIEAFEAEHLRGGDR
jgi:hypothetical protein